MLTLSRSQFAALDNANAKYEANKNILDKLISDRKILESQQSEAKEELIRVTADYKAALERMASLKDYRARRSSEMGVLDEKRDEVLGRANDLFIKVTEIRKDIESVDIMIDNINSRISDLNAEENIQNEKILDLSLKSGSFDKQKAMNNEEYERLEGELDELNRQRAEVESGNDEFERELTVLRQKMKENTSSRQVAYESTVKNENKLLQLKERQDKLGSQLWDEYEITYEDAVALEYPPVTEENREEIAHIQSSCRAKLRAIGNYNPGAIEEYARVKTQYDELNTQFVDLTSSYDDLIGIIARLENDMRTSFVDAFEAINKNFSITFRELFGGGNAELLLVDPEDVLTSGIEIKAAPPGKIIKNLALLSGGEQSFVAIALLFAILKVNPTPFCILDEIEAALDEVNVFRFAEYVRKFDDGTQFILITHRRGTMEVGDRLYGVTMPQRGISQAIELNVNEIEGKQKELLDGVL